MELQDDCGYIIKAVEGDNVNTFSVLFSLNPCDENGEGNVIEPVVRHNSVNIAGEMLSSYRIKGGYTEATAFIRRLHHEAQRQNNSVMMDFAVTQLVVGFNMSREAAFRTVRGLV